ncbi:MAG: hypothetical protein ABI333_30355 [bacterium]
MIFRRTYVFTLFAAPTERREGFPGGGFVAYFAGGCPYIVVGSLLLLAVGCQGAEPAIPRRDLKVLERARSVEGQQSTAAGDCAQKRRFYRDADGDGFGDPKKSVTGCRAPEGFVNNRDDCYDGNRRAHPGQRDYFATPRGDGSYDYDCDGLQTRRFTTRAYCRVKETGGCALASGWGRGKIPQCGEPAEFAWKVCREQVHVKPPPGDPDAGAPLPHSAGALVPGAKQKTVYQCGGRNLPWKKRQLCR